MGSDSTPSPTPMGTATTAEMRRPLSEMFPTSRASRWAAAAAMAGTTEMVMGVMKLAGRL